MFCNFFDNVTWPPDAPISSRTNRRRRKRQLFPLTRSCARCASLETSRFGAKCRRASPDTRRCRVATIARKATTMSSERVGIARAVTGRRDRLPAATNTIGKSDVYVPPDHNAITKWRFTVTVVNSVRRLSRPVSGHFSAPRARKGALLARAFYARRQSHRPRRTLPRLFSSADSPPGSRVYFTPDRFACRVCVSSARRASRFAHRVSRETPARRAPRRQRYRERTTCHFE